MCSVETWLRPWASWEARFSSRQPKRQVTSSAILPLNKRLLVVVAGRGEGRGSWFNTTTKRGFQKVRFKYLAKWKQDRKKRVGKTIIKENTNEKEYTTWDPERTREYFAFQNREDECKTRHQCGMQSIVEYSQSVRLAIPARVVMGTWGISPFMLKVRVGECVHTQEDQGVEEQLPSSHLLAPSKEHGQINLNDKPRKLLVDRSLR